MNAGSPLQTSRLLNELIALHARSLSVYLSDASPWMTAKNAHAKDVLDLVAADQQLMVDRLAERVIAHGDVVSLGGFPMEFTGLHDLSLEYLLSELVRRQQADVDRIGEIATLLRTDPAAHALAEEALGAAKGHLASLRELRQNSQPTPA